MSAAADGGAWAMRTSGAAARDASASNIADVLMEAAPGRKRAVRSRSLESEASDSWRTKVLWVLSKVGPGIVTGAADEADEADGTGLVLFLDRRGVAAAADEILSGEAKDAE